MNAGRPQGTLLFRQECQPEAQAILWQPKWNLALVLPPDRGRRTAQTAMDRLMIGADDVEGNVALEFPLSQCCCVPLGIVLAEFLFVIERRAGQQVQPSPSASR